MGGPNGLRVYRIDVREIALALVMYEATGAIAHPALTEAERDVLSAVLAGKTNIEIARERQTSMRTVANQVARLFRKFGVRSRVELVMRVADADAGKPSPEEIGR